MNRRSLKNPAEHYAPKEIIAELRALEREISEGLDELEAML